MSNFWENTALEDMTGVQWKSLCDHCGRCCLHKLEDEDRDDVYFTDVVCHYIDQQSCQCSHYETRQQRVLDCLTISPDWGDQFNWLPGICAYRLLHEKKPLFDWHPLVSGDVETAHLAGISVRGCTFSDDEVDADEIDLHIINWVN